jgi:hypothetical protein
VDDTVNTEKARNAAVRCLVSDIRKVCKVAFNTHVGYRPRDLGQNARTNMFSLYELEFQCLNHRFAESTTKRPNTGQPDIGRKV